MNKKNTCIVIISPPLNKYMCYKTNKNNLIINITKFLFYKKILLMYSGHGN